MPSPTSRTVPTSSTWRSTSNDAICWRMIELISSVLICMVLSPFVRCDKASPQVRQFPAERPVEDGVAEGDADAADGLRVDSLLEDHALVRPLLQRLAQRHGNFSIQLTCCDHDGLDAALGLITVAVERLDDAVEEKLPPFLA